MPEMPRLRVEIDFPVSPVSTPLILDHPTAGKLDTGKLAGALEWYDVTPWVRSGSCSRGARRFEDVVPHSETGTLTIELDNRGAEFDPTNADSPFFPSIVPMRAVRVRVPSDDEPRPVWRGHIDSWQLAWPGSGHDATAEISASDPQKLWVGVKLDELGTAVGDADLTGARIERVADAIGWDALDLDDGTIVMQETTYGTTAWSAAQLAADCELGFLFFAGDGSLTFRDRGTLSASPSAEFGEGAGELPYLDVSVAYTSDNLANRVTVTRIGGTAQLKEDAGSQSNYGLRTYERTDLPLYTNGAAATWAQYALDILAEPELRVEELVIDPVASDDLAAAAFGLEVGDRITVHIAAPGRLTRITRDAYIIGITHEWTPDSWTTTYALEDAS